MEIRNIVHNSLWEFVKFNLEKGDNGASTADKVSGMVMRAAENEVFFTKDCVKVAKLIKEGAEDIIKYFEYYSDLKKRLEEMGRELNLSPIELQAEINETFTRMKYDEI